MFFAGVWYWARRTLVDKAWWVLAIGGSALATGLAGIYAGILTTPEPGLRLDVGWYKLVEESFMAWNIELLSMAIGAAVVAGRNLPAGAETIAAWLFPRRDRAVLESILGIGIPSVVVAVLCSIAAHLVMMSQSGIAPGGRMVVIKMLLLPALSVSLAVALGVGLVVLTRSTVFSLICIIAFFWVLPGIFATAQISAAWLPASGLLKLAMLPVSPGNTEHLIGLLWTPALIIATILRVSYKDVA